MLFSTAEQIDVKSKYADVFNFRFEHKPDYLPSFFSISDIAHYEDILTNWYAFFFTTDAEHGFNCLFLDALCQLVNLQHKLPSAFMKTCVPIREYFTKKGNRIDLLLYDEKLNEDEFGNAIIIENKVYHYLHNDLEDYYNTVDIAAGGYKIGIVLSLSHMANLKANFISVTHIQLLNKVLELMPQYWNASRDKYLLYLKDLVQNINQLTNDIAMDKNIRFYFDNVNKFHELEEIMNQSAKYVYNQIKVAADRLGLKSSGTNEGYKYIYAREVDNIYYTILLDDLFKSGDSISVALELTGSKAIDMLSQFDEACKDLVNHKEIDFTSRYRDKDNWLYYAHVKYSISSNEIEHLGDFLYNKIKDLEPARMKLFEVYKSNL